MGVFELQFCDDIPATVSINEMIELAKGFGSENSAAFINGILDRLKAQLNRPGKAP
jgi:N utilization substance protein B